MAEDELILEIEKCYWPKSVMRGLTPLLRQLGDRHGNLVIAAVPNKHIMVKGPADRIEEVKPALRELIEEHFPDAPVPEELGGGGDQEMGGEEEWPQEEEEAPQEEDVAEEPEPPAPEPPAPEPAPAAPAPKAAVKATAPKAPRPAARAPGASAKAPSVKMPTGKLTLQDAPRKADASSKLGYSTSAMRKLGAVKKGPPPASVSGRKQPRPASMASPDLLWECTKFSSCFIRRPTRDLKRPFSAEPHNLTGLHAFKFSGIAASEALNVRPKKEGIKETIELVQSHAKPSRHRRPKSAILKTGVSQNPSKGLARLDTEIDGKFYRKDLHQLARIKYVKVQKTFKKKKVTIRSRRTGK